MKKEVIQCESTKRLLEAQLLRKDDVDYILQIKNKPVPKEAYRLKEDGSIDLGIRDISKEEHDAYELHRRGRGARIEQRWKPENKALEVKPTEGQRNNAIAAFTGTNTIEKVKAAFKTIFEFAFPPSHAEVVAEEIKKLREEKND